MLLVAKHQVEIFVCQSRRLIRFDNDQPLFHFRFLALFPCVRPWLARINNLCWILYFGKLGLWKWRWSITFFPIHRHVTDTCNVLRSPNPLAHILARPYICTGNIPCPDRLGKLTILFYFGLCTIRWSCCRNEISEYIVSSCTTQYNVSPPELI